MLLKTADDKTKRLALLEDLNTFIALAALAFFLRYRLYALVASVLDAGTHNLT